MLLFKIPGVPLFRLFLLVLCLMTGLSTTGLLWGGEPSQGPSSRAADPPSVRRLAAGESLLLNRAFDLYRRGAYGEAALAAEKFLSGVTLPKEEEAARFLQGDCYYQSLDSNRTLNSQLALNSYQRALQKFPHSVLAPKVIYRMAEIYSGQRQYDKGNYLSKKIMTQHYDSPWEPWSALLLGKNLLHQGREAEGLKILNALGADSSHSPAALESHVRLMEYFIEKGKFSEALDQYRHIRSNHEIVDCAEDLEKVPQLLVRLGRAGEARELLFKLVNLLPEDPRAPRWAVMIGDAYDSEERVTEALKSYYEARKRFSHTPGAALAQAGILALRAREASPLVFQQIVEEYDVLAAAPQNWSIRTDLLMRKAVMLNRIGHAGDSVVVLGELLRLHPARSLKKEALALYEQAFTEEVRILAQAGKYGDIVILVQKSSVHLPLSSLDEKTARIIAESHFEAGLFHAAVAQMEKLVQGGAPAAEDERFLWRLGRAYLELGQADRTLAVLQDVLHRFPESVVQGDALTLMGQAALENKDEATAIDYLRLALKAGKLKEEGLVYYLLGSAYRQQGQRLAALQAFQSAVKVNGEGKSTRGEGGWEESARYALADMLYESGRGAEALPVYRGAIARFPEAQSADWARYRVAQIHMENQGIQEAIRILEEMGGRKTDRILSQLVRHSKEEIAWQQAFKELF